MFVLNLKGIGHGLRLLCSKVCMCIFINKKRSKSVLGTRISAHLIVADLALTVMVFLKARFTFSFYVGNSTITTYGINL